MLLAELVERALRREQTLRLQRAKSGGPFVVSRLRAAHPGPILVVSPSSAAAATFAADLVTFGSGADRAGASVHILPSYDTPPYDR